MVTSTAAPQTGAHFQRLDLKAVVDGLQSLEADAETNGGLSIEQAHWFNRYLNAWDFYRLSQPEDYQMEVERAIATIFAHHTWAGISR
ncbi:MAG: hypothetical protein WBA99_13515 [Nodosilinea sp.]